MPPRPPRNQFGDTMIEKVLYTERPDGPKCLNLEAIKNPNWNLWIEFGLLPVYSAAPDYYMVQGLKYIHAGKYYTYFRDEMQIGDEYAEMIYTMWAGLCGDYGSAPRGCWLDFKLKEEANLFVAHVEARHRLEWDGDGSKMTDEDKEVYIQGVVGEILVINRLTGNWPI